MNYYTRHLGDYARDTGHLSVLEHGIYTLLLDRYYITEQGIPSDQVYRMARARTDDEITAVDAVLADFFELKDGIWINHRAEEEIIKANVRIDAAVENGRKGGRPRKHSNNPSETQGEPSNNPAGTQGEPRNNPVESSPNTKHQTPIKTLSTNNTHTVILEPVSEIELAGRVCVALRDVGIMQANSSHADLLQLIRDGTTLEEFVSAGSIARENGKGFAYALGVVKSRKAEKINGKSHAKQTKHRENTVDPGFAEKYPGLA